MIYLFLLFIFFELSLSQYCDNCPLNCCNKYGSCASYAFQCSCRFETSYQITSGLKCKNCCTNYKCVNDSGNSICEVVKSLNEIGKILGLVIGILFGTCFICIIIIVCVKRRKRVNILVQTSNNNVNSPNLYGNDNANQEIVGIPLRSENLPPLNDQMLGVPIYDGTQVQNQYPHQINNYGGYNYPTNVIPMSYPQIPSQGGYNQIPQNYVPNSGNSNNNIYPSSSESRSFPQNNNFSNAIQGPDNAQNINVLTKA